MIELGFKFTPQEFAMLARIVDAGMWDLASKPHTPEEAALWDRVCQKLGVPGYEDKNGHTPDQTGHHEPPK